MQQLLLSLRFGPVYSHLALVYVRGQEIDPIVLAEVNQIQKYAVMILMHDHLFGFQLLLVVWRVYVSEAVRVFPPDFLGHFQGLKERLVEAIRGKALLFVQETGDSGVQDQGLVGCNAIGDEGACLDLGLIKLEGTRQTVIVPLKRGGFHRLCFKRGSQEDTVQSLKIHP